MLQLEISSSDVLRIETEDIIEHYPGIVTLNKVFLLMSRRFEPLSDNFASIFGEFFNVVAPPFSSRLAASPPAYTEPSLPRRRSQMEFGCAKTRRTCASPREPLLPYMGYIGICRCEGYGFQAVYSGIEHINHRVWV